MKSNPNTLLPTEQKILDLIRANKEVTAPLLRKAGLADKTIKSRMESLQEKGIVRIDRWIRYSTGSIGAVWVEVIKESAPRPAHGMPSVKKLRLVQPDTLKTTILMIQSGTTAADIADELGVSTHYVHQVAKDNGLQVKLPSGKLRGDLKSVEAVSVLQRFAFPVSA